MIICYLTNNEVASELGISASAASTAYTRAFKKMLKGCKEEMRRKGLEMTDQEIIVLFIKFGYIDEHDIPRSIMKEIKNANT